MPADGEHKKTGPNFGGDDSFVHRVLGFGNDDYSDSSPWWRILAVLFVIACLVTCVYFTIGFKPIGHWVGHEWSQLWASSPKTATHTPAAPAKTQPSPVKTAEARPTPVAPKTDTVAPNTDAKVFCTPEDMLTKTRAARVKSMDQKVALAVRQHKLTRAQAAERLALVQAYPDGWRANDWNAKQNNHSNYTIDGDKVTVTWDGAIGLRSVAHCNCFAESAITYPAPPVVHHIAHPYVVITRMDNGCYGIDIYGTENTDLFRFGYDSAVGPLPHGCQTIQQGSGPVQDWNNDRCVTRCLPKALYVYDMLDEQMPTTREFYAVGVTAGHIHMTVSDKVLNMVMHFCFTFKDRTETRFFYLTPPGHRPGGPNLGNYMSWGNAHHVTLPNVENWPLDVRPGTAIDDSHSLQ